MRFCRKIGASLADDHGNSQRAEIIVPGANHHVGMTRGNDIARRDDNAQSRGVELRMGEIAWRKNVGEILDWLRDKICRQCRRCRQARGQRGCRRHQSRRRKSQRWRHLRRVARAGTAECETEKEQGENTTQVCHIAEGCADSPCIAWSEGKCLLYAQSSVTQFRELSFHFKHYGVKYFQVPVPPAPVSSMIRASAAHI